MFTIIFILGAKGWIASDERVWLLLGSRSLPWRKKGETTSDTH